MSEKALGPNHSHVAGDDGFRVSAYEFITFLYAAAVHLVIHHAEISRSQNIIANLFVLLLIIFMFSDWASRTRLPRLIPEKVRGYKVVLKISLEIIGIFFLVSSFLILVSHDTGDANQDSLQMSAALGFGMFLISTFLWNYLMIGVMVDLDVVDLRRAVLWGTAIDMKSTKDTYLYEFGVWKERRAKELEEQTKRIKNQISSISGDAGGAMMRGGARVSANHFSFRAFEAAVSAVAQFIANHVLYANLVAGLAIVINRLQLWDELTSRMPLLKGWHIWEKIQFDSTVAITLIGASLIYCTFLLGGWWWIVAAIIAIVALFQVAAIPNAAPWLVLGGWVSVAFLASSVCYLVALYRWRRPCVTIAGASILLTLLVLYISLPPYLLVGLVAAQQIFVNTFLQFTASSMPVERPAKVGIPEPEPTPA